MGILSESDQTGQKSAQNYLYSGNHRFFGNHSSDSGRICLERRGAGNILRIFYNKCNAPEHADLCFGKTEV